MMFDDLREAVVGGNAVQVKRLLIGASPALINAVDERDNSTFLGEAVMAQRSLDVVALLLRAGADTALRCGRCEPGRPMHHAVGWLECVELLLRCGADVNARNCLGETPLIRAARQGACSRVVERLLAAGADADDVDVDHEGNAAINYALVDGHEHILLMLLAAKADCSPEQIGPDYKSRRLTSQITLSCMGLCELPIELLELKNLNKLSLNRNELTSLPAWLGQLATLETILACDTSLASLPAELGQLSKLTHLRVYGSRLESLPASLGQLTNLVELSVAANQLTSLPTWLGQLTNLKALWVHYNQLTSLPAELGQLTKLNELWFGSSQLKSLPAWLGQLTNLTSLYVAANPLTSLPAWLGQLTNLKELRIPGNQLTSLPAWLGQLTNLTLLFVDDNLLESLPAELGQLTNLAFLSLSGNPLPSIAGLSYDDNQACARRVKGIVEALNSAAAAAAPVERASSSGARNIAPAVVSQHSAAELAVARAVIQSLRAENQSLREQRDVERASVLSLNDQVRTLRAQLHAAGKQHAKAIVPQRIDAKLVDYGPRKVLIGRGAAAFVYAASFGGEAVAVKEVSGNSDAIKEAVEQELAIAKRLIGHANIVSVFGIVEQPTALILVMERLPMSLADALHGNDSLGMPAMPSISFVQRVRIGHGVASALRFCHAQLPPVLHRDLKPGNVLLSADLLTVKLCDFGSSRQLALGQQMTLGVGTPQYTAPEVLNPQAGAKYSCKIDVYSFGVLVWELFAGTKPFAGMLPMQLPMAVCMQKLRPTPDPPMLSAALRTLMKKCWAHESRKRPATAAVVATLGQELTKADAAESDAAAARNECVICVDQARAVALVPCGHMCCCADCAGDVNECPVCRTGIENRLKVFMV